jgi:hypothetical protein
MFSGIRCEKSVDRNCHRNGTDVLANENCVRTLKKIRCPIFSI